MTSRWTAERRIGYPLILEVTPSPDGRRLATIVADDGSDGGSAEPEDLGLVGDWGAKPLAAPDGRWIACHTSDRPGRWALSGSVSLYPIESGEPRPLAGSPPAGHSRRWAQRPRHRDATAAPPRAAIIVASAARQVVAAQSERAEMVSWQQKTRPGPVPGNTRRMEEKGDASQGDGRRALTDPPSASAWPS